MRIWILGLLPLLTDPDLAIFVSDLQDANKKFLCLLLFEGTFTLLLKDKDVTKQ